MGAFLSTQSTWADPVTGLSARDRYLVNNSWAMVKKDLKGAGMHVFKLLFEQHPDVQEMFPFAKGKSYEEYKSDPRFAAHINSVLYTLTSVVDHLDDPDVLEAMIRKTGVNHYRRSVSMEQFKVLGGVLVQALNDLLGPRVMNAETTASWGKTYTHLMKILEEELKRCAEEQQT